MSDFTIVIRGYDRAQVDKTIALAETALRSADPVKLAEARDALRRTDFEVSLRGYDREQVDAFMARLAAHLLTD